MIVLLLSLFGVSSGASTGSCLHYDDHSNEITAQMDMVSYRIANAEDLSSVNVVEEMEQLIQLQREYEALTADGK